MSSGCVIFRQVIFIRPWLPWKNFYWWTKLLQWIFSDSKDCDYIYFNSDVCKNPLLFQKEGHRDQSQNY